MESKLETIRVGTLHVAVWLHTAVDPPATEWDAHITRMRQLKQSAQRDLDRVRSIVVSDGGAPSAKQRTILFNDVLESRTKTAVVTNSLSNPIKRGIVTALTWLSPSFRAFGPERALDALIHLDCAGTREQEAIWATLTDLQRDLPPIVTLREMARALDRPLPAT